MNIRNFINTCVIPIGSARRKSLVKVYQFVFKKDKTSLFDMNKPRKEKQEKSLTLNVSALDVSVDNNQKKKVLIIPSWYPTSESPIVGSFFREQGHIMETEYDVKVLFGQVRYNEIDSVEIIKNYPFAEPETIAFFYTTSDRLEIENFDVMIHAYELILDKLISQGWKPDVIHAHSVFYGGIIAHHLGKKINIPTIITEHSVFLLHNYSKFIQNKIFEALENVNKVLAVSTDKMKFILMHNIKCDPVVIGNMVDCNLFAPAKITKNPNTYRILTVAGASYLKDLQTFLKSIKAMVDKGHHDIVATIVGNGVWGDENYEEYVKELGIEKFCRFVSTVERKDMPSFYNDCDVFVSTSIAEGFQVSILEAMACGRPVVSTSHGGVEDIMCSDNGILLKIRDYNGIANAISDIKEGKIKFDSDKIRKIVNEKFGKEVFRNSISDIYKSVIN